LLGGAAIAGNITDRQSACDLVDRWMGYSNTQRAHSGWINKGLPPVALLELHEHTPGDHLTKLVNLGLLKLDQDRSLQTPGPQQSQDPPPTSSSPSRLLPDSPNAGWVTASPPPHPRRWAPAPSCSESARGPPRLPRRQLRRPWARCGLGRGNSQRTPRPQLRHPTRIETREGGAVPLAGERRPAMAGDSKGLTAPAPFATSLLRVN